MRLCRPFMCLMVMLAVAAGGLHAQPSPAPDYVPGQILVRFEKQTTLSEAKTSLDPSLFVPQKALVPSLNIFLVKLATKVDARTACDFLKGDPRVRWAQPDHILAERSTTPNDPLFSTQWNLSQASDADIDAPEAWDITTGGTDLDGNSVVVAEVDGGCLLSHQDLADNIWTNPGEIPDDSLDNDGNGYIDDVNGWNAYDDMGELPITNHGTHVAGIIGARGNNGVMVSGVNWNVKIMIVAASSTQTSVIAAGYNYVIAQKDLWWSSGGTLGANIVVTNSSFGVNYADCSSGDYPIWNDLYNAMGEIGILSACATANITIDVDAVGDVPTGCSSPYIISVTNTTSSDEKNNRAAYGDSTIDLGAPGTNIRSTTSNNSTGILSGTSMSTPHVSGAVALMHAAANAEFRDYYMTQPGQASLALKDVLLNHVDLLPGFDTLTVSGGRLNLFLAAAAMDSFVEPDTIFSGVQIEAPNGGELFEIGDTVHIVWSSFGLNENVKIEINLDYPTGEWTTIFADTVNNGSGDWIAATDNSSIHVRMRVSGVVTTDINDVSDGDFTIINLFFKLLHDPLDDFAPGTGVITVWSWDDSPLRQVIDVSMFYRPAGNGAFDSLELLPTANTDEFSADLSFLGSGDYEYFIRAEDEVGRVAMRPDSAPDSLYSFRVDDLCLSTIAYDDGSAELFNWSAGEHGNGYIWAIKFGPVATPFRLCGARFVASRSLPDSSHSQVVVSVYAADGEEGEPGTLIHSEMKGSVGNVIGGLPSGTNWAEVILRDSLGNPLLLNTTEFYISVQNPVSNFFEAFGRDSSGPDYQRSYFYDPCVGRWYSEEDEASTPNAHSGNRMIRAVGYSVLAPQLVHDPLDDVAEGAGTVTAWVYSSSLDLPITSVNMNYRLEGGGAFTALPMSPSGYANEFAASLASLPAGTYEYYVECANSEPLTTLAPANAPDSLYRFRVFPPLGMDLAYDDGSAERYTWYDHDIGEFRWAVKFEPATLPYFLCGARFAASRNLPDTSHSCVHVALFAADGADGLPSTLLREIVCGSIGNDIGGIPMGTNWAMASLLDSFLHPLAITDSAFYIAVSNANLSAYESIGRDTTGENQHRSYFYDACDSQWYSEDDTTLTDNAHPGNRLIRAVGYEAEPPNVVVMCSGNDIILHWNNTGAPLYTVYSSDVPAGPYDFLQSTADTMLTVAAVDTSGLSRFYQVRSSTE